MATFYKDENDKFLAALQVETPAPAGFTALEANTTDAATEKHVPAVSETEDGKLLVTVGSVEHPMTPEHYIEWIAYADEKKTIVKHLKPGDKPQAKFCHKGQGATVYAYCNLHGLWKTEL